MMKCLEVKVGVTEPSYHSAIRRHSDSQSCDAAENRAHRLASIESPTAVRVRKAVLLEFPVRGFGRHGRPGSYGIALRAFSRKGRRNSAVFRGDSRCLQN
jgi:hypothetical protein